MKKLFTLVSMALMAVGANAQLIYEIDLTEKTDVGFMISATGTDCTYEHTTDGIILNNPGDKEAQIWTPQSVVTEDAINLEMDESYTVRFNVIIPAGEDQKYQVQMGTWGSNFQYEVPVTGGDDVQILDVPFPDFGADLEGAHVVFQNGWVTGTTILKKVEVWHGDPGETAIKSVKNAAANNNVRYNLAGQKVDANYKGVVIMNGKKSIQK